MLLINIPPSITATPLPARLTPSFLKITKTDHATLLKKQSWLKEYSVVLPRGVTHDPSPATYVFAQEEAGTAVCISPNGVLLTCSHCVAETREELEWEKVHWLLSGSGDVVGARTVAWDSTRDLALLLITRSNVEQSYSHIDIAQVPPRRGTALICVGHPGSEDLETSIPGVQTNYDTLVSSTGKYHGLAEGQDEQDSSEIGALMHSCWTYWGHSGAPLVEKKEGRLVGVHSSWDDETGMRRGVGLGAIRAFFGEFEGSVGEVGGLDGWVWWAE